MATDHPRNRGSLFSNADKRKPSQPDHRGECTIDGATYDMQAWVREEQLTLTLAPTRGDKNTYPPDAFRGQLDPAPTSGRGAKDENRPVWTGTIVGDEAAFAVSAFRKQGKSGPYLTLQFERTERPVDERAAAPSAGAEAGDADPDD